MNELIAKAAILHEALPYIQRFHGRTFVIKLGGHAMTDQKLKESFARDVCLLRYVGVQVVIVHGAGPQISNVLERFGIPSVFKGGLRVTDDRTMDVVEMVLGGTVNQDIVNLICGFGGRAVGLRGSDDRFIRARKMGPVAGVDEDGTPTDVDLGRVGKVEHIDPGIIDNIVTDGFIPVVAPLGVGEDGKSLNINADTAAGRIGSALNAAKLVLMTDVEGVKDDSGTLMRSLRARDAERLIASETIRGGMIPKVQCALAAVDDGVEKAHIIDGRIRHALLLEIFTDVGVGTEIQRIRD